MLEGGGWGCGEEVVERLEEGALDEAEGAVGVC